MESDSFPVRASAPFLVGISAPGSVLAASHYGASPGSWLIAIPCTVLIAAILAGYYEPFAKRVWIHAVLLMLPESVALPVAILTCKGHGCVAAIVLLAIAIPSTFVLIAVSYAAFFIRRKRASTTVGVRA
jgi:hypothetical protein